MSFPRAQKIGKLDVLLERVKRNRRDVNPTTEAVPEAADGPEEIEVEFVAEDLSDMETTRPPATFSPTEGSLTVAQDVLSSPNRQSSAEVQEELKPVKLEADLAHSQAVAVMVGKPVEAPPPNFDALVAASLSLNFPPSD